MEQSTTQITKDYIKEHPFIKSCLKRDLINYSALARRISEELGIEKTSSVEAILVASRRYKDELKKEKTYEKKIKNLLSASEIEIKNKIIVFIIKKSVSNDSIMEIQKKINKSGSIFYYLEGSDNYTLVAQEKDSEYIKGVLKTSLIKSTKDLVMVNLKSPKEIEHINGVLSYLTSLFAENNVNIVEFMSCWTDTLFIISKKDLEKAINFLNF